VRQHPSAIILLLAVLFSCQPETGGLPPATEPTVEEPGGQTDQPGGQTDEPGGQTDQPGGQTDEPGGQTDQPGGQTDEPGGQTDEPGGQTDEPGGQTDEPGGQTDQPGGQTGEPGLHKCSETMITDDMIFSSCCSRTTTSVQQGFDYDPVDNTLYFSQLNRWYRNIISWTTPAVTLSTDVAPKYMGLSCFSHGNNFIIERTASGEKYVWAPNFGSRGDGSYGNPWIVSRFPLKETSGVKGDILNTDPDDNYYFGVSPCWPAIDFENDLIAICAIKKTYVYRLSQLLALPRTKVTLPKAITYGGIITSTGSTSTYDSGIPEFTGKPEILARDATTIPPLLEFDTSYSQRGLRWQTFCIGGGKAYFLRMGDVPEGSVIKHDSYIEVYDLSTGALLRPKVQQKYMQDIDGLVARGYVESNYCYAEPEGIKVMGDALYVLYTCRGNTDITVRRPVIIKISKDI
jgi:hypothetical protein